MTKMKRPISALLSLLLICSLFVGNLCTVSVAAKVAPTPEPQPCFYQLTDKFEAGKTYLIASGKTGCASVLTNNKNGTCGMTDVMITDGSIIAKGLDCAEWTAQTCNPWCIGLYNGGAGLIPNAYGTPKFSTGSCDFSGFGGFGYGCGHLSCPISGSPCFVGFNDNCFDACKSDFNLGDVFLFVKCDSFGPCEMVTFDQTVEMDEGNFIIVSNGFALYNDNGTMKSVPVIVNGNQVTIRADWLEGATWKFEDAEGTDKSGDYVISNNGSIFYRISDASGNAQTAGISDSLPMSSYSGLPYFQWTYDVDGETLSQIGGQDRSATFYAFFNKTTGCFYTGRDLTGCTLYCVLDKFDVTFDMGGHGEQVDPQRVYDGKKAVEPEEPTDPDYNFEGWYADPDFEEEFDFDNDVITADTVIYAKWSGPNVSKFRRAVVMREGDYIVVSGGYALYNDNGIMKAVPVTVEGDVVTILTSKVPGATWNFTESTGFCQSGEYEARNNFFLFERVSDASGNDQTAGIFLFPALSPTTGYPYYQWTYDPANEYLTQVGGSGMTTDFYAYYNELFGWFFTGRGAEHCTLYRLVDPEYDVTFEMNGHGEQVDPQHLLEGDKAVRPDDPEETGYDFDGWFADKDFGTEFDFDQMILGDTTIYAKWTALYNVTFDMNGRGEQVDPQIVRDGEYAAKPADPDDDHYAFIGWYADEDLRVPFDFENDAITGPTVIYAGWLGYTVTAEVTNGTATPETQTVKPGTDPTVSFEADEGYALDTVLVDGKPAELDEDGTYTFEDIDSNHTITVTFSEDKNGDGIPDKYQAVVTYMIDHGTWSDGTSERIKVYITLYDYEGGVWTLKEPAATLGDTIPTGMIPATGYDIATGKWTPAITAATFAANGAAYEYDFEKLRFKISVDVENGTSDPEGPEVIVIYGEDQTIKFEPDDGYTFDTVLVDGKPAELVDGEYTFEDVTAPHTIVVTFSEDKNEDEIPDKYQAFVTYKVAHGTWADETEAPITVCITLYDYTEGEWIVKDPAATLGDTIPTGMIPATGYDINTGKWTPAITADTAAKDGAAYEYDFEKLRYTFTVTVENGKSDPAGPEVIVIYGDDQTFTFTPNKGYAFDMAYVDGTPAVLTDGAYTFSYVTAAHDIKVVFSEDKNGDGIPDKYQATLTFNVEHGCWDDGTMRTIVEVYTLYAYGPDGTWKPIDVVIGERLPYVGNRPDRGYWSGSWNVPITTLTPVTEDADYLYSYKKSKIPAEIDSRFALTVTKVDADDASFKLAGAKFDLYNVSKKGETKIGTYITNRDGYIRADVNGEGDYYWIETRSPLGYTIDETKYYVSTTPGKRDIVIANSKTETPAALNGENHYAYVIGYTDGLVHPEKDITRAEVVTIFYRLLNDDVRSEYETNENNFTDVYAGDWFNTAVSTIAALGIVKGSPDGSFRPNDPVTRAEFTAIASRFDDSNDYAIADFSDIEGHWAEVEICKAVAKGWVSGYTDNSFKPDKNINRAEAMALINRVMNRNPETPDDLLAGMIEWPDNSDTECWYYLDVQEATNSHEYIRKSNNTEKWIDVQ